jgi:hypothetical protein
MDAYRVRSTDGGASPAPRMSMADVSVDLDSSKVEDDDEVRQTGPPQPPAEPTAPTVRAPAWQLRLRGPRQDEDAQVPPPQVSAAITGAVIQNLSGAVACCDSFQTWAAAVAEVAAAQEAHHGLCLAWAAAAQALSAPLQLGARAGQRPDLRPRRASDRRRRRSRGKRVGRRAVCGLRRPAGARHRGPERQRLLAQPAAGQTRGDPSPPHPRRVRTTL